MSLFIATTQNINGSLPFEYDIKECVADYLWTDRKRHQFNAGRVQRVRRGVRELVEPPVARRKRVGFTSDS